MNKHSENNCCASRSMKLFSLAASMIMIAFFFITNYLTSWEYPWFLYPSFAVIWWPLGLFFLKPGTDKAYSAIGAVVILTFFAQDNLLHAPTCPWMFFTVFPVLLWPTCIFLGSRARSLAAALGLSTLGIVYYILLNLSFFPGFPWAVFPAYVLLWWPLSVAFAARGHSMAFATGGALLSAALFIWLNAVATPQTVWAVYPIFVLAWWPLGTYYFVYKPRQNYNGGIDKWIF